MSAPRIFAYVAVAARNIAVLSMSAETGELTKIQEIRAQSPDAPQGAGGGRHMAMALSPDQRFLYTSNRNLPYSINTFAINRADGTLTHLAESTTVDTVPFMSTDRSGRFLLAAHNPPDRKRRDGYITVSAITEHGIALSPHQIMHTPQKMHSIMPDPSNRFAFAPACDADVVLRCTFDVATGMLNPDGLSPLYTRPQSGPRHHRYHPNGRFLYINNEYDGTIYCYSYDARDGSVSQIQIAESRPPQMDKDANVRVSDMRITANGRWLYSGIRGLPSIAIFGVDAATGLLTPAGHCMVPKEPRGFNLDPFGRFLLDSAEHENRVLNFRINPQTGVLDKVAELALEKPNWVKFVRLP